MATMAGMLVAQLTQVSSYIDAQKQTPGIDVSVVLDAQCRAFVAQINVMPKIDMADATTLTNAINAGPWSADQRAQLVTALSTHHANLQLGAASGKHDVQSLRSIQKYLPASVWSALVGDVTVAESAVLAFLKERMGLTNPEPRTAAHINAFLILRVHKKPGMPPAEMYQNMRRVKEFLAKHSKKSLKPTGHIVVFPEEPTDLPQNVLKAIYLPNDPPIHHDVPGLQNLTENMGLRKTHKSVREVVAPPAVNFLGAASSSAGGSGANNFAGGGNQFAAMLQAFAMANPQMVNQLMQFCSQPQQQNIGLSFNGPAASPAASPPKALPAPKYPALPPVPVGAFDAGAHGVHGGDADDDDVGDVAGESSADALPMPGEMGENAVGEYLRNTSGAFQSRAKAKGKRGLKAKGRGAGSASAHGVGGVFGDVDSEASADDVEEEYDEPTSTPKKRKVCKKPAGVLKRPAAVAGVRVPAGPRMPDISVPGRRVTPVLWNGGTIYYSEKKQAWRVLPTTGDRVDKMVRFYGNPAAAWSQAMEIISDARKS